MISEFQVVYLQALSPRPIDLVGTLQYSEPRTITIQVPSEAAARAVFPSPEFEVLSVTEVRLVVDWSKPVWNLDEFAAALGMKPGSLSAKKGDGKIPWSKKFGGVPRELALRCIEESLNDCGKQLARELRNKNL